MFERTPIKYLRFERGTEMITDLFEDSARNRGNSNGFSRLMLLDLDYGLDYLCRGNICATLFIRTVQEMRDMKKGKGNDK